MIGWQRRVALLGFGLLTIHSCTCQKEPAPDTNKFSERGGFSAKLHSEPTKERRQGDKMVRVARPTPALPTLPLAEETPTPGMVELPDDFPTDVPVYEKAEAFAVQKVAADGRTVLFRSEAQPTEIFTFYKDTMKKEGWNSSQEYQTKDQSFLSFQKGTTITNVTVAKDPRTGKQIIAVMYYKEEPLKFPEF